VLVNRRNLAKAALTFGNPMRWVARYGNVTFNLYGAEFPMGGMNEAGLVIETMWLEETEYPAADSLPGLNDVQWIQYHLDTHETVAEVLESASSIGIYPDTSARIHYLIADATGACASVEFLGGRMIVHTGDALPLRALTNTPYDASLDTLRRIEATHPGFVPDDNSLGRFVVAARSVKRFEKNPPDDAIDYAFRTLDNVRQAGHTQWTIVYDIAHRQIRFRTLENRAIRLIDLAKLDFSCSAPRLMHDLETKDAGDISGKFEPYSADRNLALVKRAFANTSFLAHVGDDMLQLIARYPDTFPCRE
jgi:penicillin V acylase-like amidase (Ntn superfamily)